MLQYKRITIFLLLALFLSVLATPPDAGLEPELGNNGTDEAWVEELWDGYRPDSFSYTRSLKDWSHCYYSSKQWCAFPSVVRWGGKFYDPLSFKGTEDDSYGTYRTKSIT